MKRMKKLFAILMTMAMVMGLGITGFAAEVTDITSDITVRGLSDGVTTTLKVKKAVYLDDTNGIIEWKVAGWAENYIDFDETTKEVTVIDAEGLYEAVGDQATEDETYEIQGTSHTFEGMSVGAYVIIANDAKAEYSPMIANNYDRDATDDTGVKAKDVYVNAKAESHQLTKEIIGGDSFVKRGEEVQFKITGIFPAYYNEETEKTLNSFKIKDTYKGISIKEGSTTITIGDSNVTSSVDIKDTVNSTDETKTDRTFDFAQLIDAQTKAYEGQLITITYTAVVEDPDTYNNTVDADAPTVDYGEDEVIGWSGNIVITKKDAEDQSLVLDGAEFEIYPYEKDGTTVSTTPLQFVTTTETPDADDTTYYMLAKAGEAGANSKVVATNGIVKVKGLEDGKYFIKEVKAPKGYSINEGGSTVTIAAGNETVSVPVDFLDTKLSSLPETGGMGITLFTIAGCVIMISAAGLFFATRKKAN